MALNKQKKQELTREMERQKMCETLEKERCKIDDKTKSRTLIRLLNTQRKEQENSDAVQQVKEREAYLERQLTREENLAREFDALKRENINEIRERQLLRENSPELRQLETQLRCAYIARSLHAQMAEKEANKIDMKLKNLEINKTLEDSRVNVEEYERQIKQDEINKKYQYKTELQDQMILKEKMKRHMYEEFLKEKKLVDDVIERIHLEDERALQEKWCRMQKTKAEMESFKQAQLIWRQKEKDEIEQENLRLQAYIFSKQSNLAELAAEKKRKEAIKEEIANTIAKKIYEDRTKQREREDIQLELMEQEFLEASDLRARQETELKFRRMFEQARSLDKQIEEKEDKIKAEAAEDEELRQMMMKKINEDDKLEQLTAEKKRIRKLQLRKDLQELIIQRRQRYAEDMQILLKLQEERERELAERNRKIETERIRMLQEHAKNLIGYLPKGVLRQDDLQILPEEVAAAYSKPQPQ